MGRRVKNDFYADLVRLFEAAQRALRLLPRDGCYPAGYRSTMPQPVREWWAAYDSESARADLQKVKLSAMRDDIGSLDTALKLIAGATLTTFERTLIWDRAKRVPWKEIADRHSMPLDKLRRAHANALASVAHYAIAMKRKRVA